MVFGAGIFQPIHPNHLIMKFWGGEAHGMKILRSENEEVISAEFDFREPSIIAMDKHLPAMLNVILLTD